MSGTDGVVLFQVLVEQLVEVEWLFVKDLFLKLKAPGKMHLKVVVWLFFGVSFSEVSVNLDEKGPFDYFLHDDVLIMLQLWLQHCLE